MDYSNFLTDPTLVPLYARFDLLAAIIAGNIPMGIRWSIAFEGNGVDVPYFAIRLETTLEAPMKEWRINETASNAEWESILRSVADEVRSLDTYGLAGAPAQERPEPAYDNDLPF